MRNLTPVAALCAALAVGGCSSIPAELGGERALALLEDVSKGVEKVEEHTLGNAGKALALYCQAPSVARTTVRARMNARVEANGAKIGIHCPGDPVLTLGP